MTAFALGVCVPLLAISALVHSVQRAKITHLQSEVRWWKHKAGVPEDA